MKKVCILCLIVLLALGILPKPSLAYNWAIEEFTGIPNLSNAFISGGNWPVVTSSWNEPRSGGAHKGSDHRAIIGTEIGPMYSGVSGATILNCGTFTDGTIWQAIRYTSGVTTFYTLYLHLDSCLQTTGTAYVGDATAETGDTGSSGSPHLHFEINSNNPTSNFGARVSVNPHDYVINRQKQRSVFKNWTVSYVSSIEREVKILATNFNLGTLEILSYVDIYYRPTHVSTWSGPYSMTGDGTGYFSYSLIGPLGTSYDVVIAGRRSTSEYWVTYPAKKTTETTTGSSVPMNSYFDWDTKTVTF